MAVRRLDTGRLTVTGPEVANEAHHHALDDEFTRRNEIGVERVLSLEKWATIFHQVALQGGLAINEGGHDVTRPRLTVFEDDAIPIEDVGIDHRIASDVQGKGLRMGGGS